VSFIGGVDGGTVESGHDFLILEIGFYVGVFLVFSFDRFSSDFFTLVVDEDGVFIDVAGDL